MLLALQMTVFLSTVMVMGPATVLPPTADAVAQIIRYDAVESSLMPPSLIEISTQTLAPSNSYGSK